LNPANFARTNFKFVLAGDGAVGKTALKGRFTKKQFTGQYLPTVGVEFTATVIKIGDVSIRAQLWDLAGQPNFKQIRAGFMKGATGALLVYSIVDENSFSNVRNWITEIHTKCLKGKIPIVLAGNKIDLRESGLAMDITDEQGKKFASELSEELESKVLHVPTSAKTGENVDLSFQLMTSQTCLDLTKDK